jgi:hypothetical protein
MLLALRLRSGVRANSSALPTSTQLSGPAIITSAVLSRRRRRAAL